MTCDFCDRDISPKSSAWAEAMVIYDVYQDLEVEIGITVTLMRPTNETKENIKRIPTSPDICRNCMVKLMLKHFDQFVLEWKPQG
jgi:hypothetical protein